MLAGEQRGGLAGLGQQAMGYTGGFFSSLSTEENLPKTALTLAGGATVGAFLPGAAATTGLGAGSAAGVGGATGAGGATLANSSVLYSGRQAALTQQLPQWVIPTTVTAGAGAAWMSGPWSPMQQGMMPYVNTERPTELGDPSGVRKDLIPMTGDLPAQVEGIPMEPPMPQVLGEDPVQVPGAHDPLTTPMEGPQLPQVESFPDAELNQPGEAEAESPSGREARALERAMQANNWEQVKGYIGQAVSAGLPPGYSFRDKSGGELVRQIQDDSQQVPLQLDENGLIQIRVGSSNRISNPTEMDKNFTRAYGPIAKGYEKHHLNPDNQVQDLKLLQFAHEQGWYNLDRASNLLGMPGKEKWEAIQSGEEQPVTGPGYTNTMGHWSSHGRYDEEVVTREIDRRTQLILEHFGVGKLSEVPQERMDELKDMVMNNITEAENRFRQMIDSGQVRTKDGRISWGAMNEREAA